MTNNTGPSNRVITDPHEERVYSPKEAMAEPDVPPPGRPGMSPSESTGTGVSSQESSGTDSAK